MQRGSKLSIGRLVCGDLFITCTLYTAESSTDRKERLRKLAMEINVVVFLEISL